jgi:hypothetical protein
MSTFGPIVLFWVLLMLALLLFFPVCFAVYWLFYNIGLKIGSGIRGLFF